MSAASRWVSGRFLVTESLNLAACHACVLLPETSCELGNTILDRAMLIGTPEKPSIGFFTDGR